MRGAGRDGRGLQHDGFHAQARHPVGPRQLPDPRKAAEFSLFLARLLQSYGQRPLYCRLSSRSEILWELLEDEAP